MTAPQLVDDFFRHEYGRMVAVLCRRVGAQHIEVVEDAAQNALMSALATWPVTGVPSNPTAWLFRAAHNEVISELRTRARRDVLLGAHSSAFSGVLVNDGDGALEGDGTDDMLRMLFVCCDDAIPLQSQLVLALKTLCGFDVREIALRLFVTEAVVYKRLSRAKQRLQELPLDADALTPANFADRLPAVRQILYHLFAEGYLSSHAEYAIREELCREAIRLTTLLAEHPLGEGPETFALLALMHLHLARVRGRRDATGGLLLLEEQDRSLWDQNEMAVGMTWLARSASGDALSRYHAEAGVAAEHCLAESVSATRWEKIVEYYALLERIAPSPIHTLNRAVAMAEWRGAEAGLAALGGLHESAWVEENYLGAAVLADLHRRFGHVRQAENYLARAIDGAPTEAVRVLIGRRFGSGGSGTDPELRP